MRNYSTYCLRPAHYLPRTWVRTRETLEIASASLLESPRQRPRWDKRKLRNFNVSHSCTVLFCVVPVSGSVKLNGRPPRFFFFFPPFWKIKKMWKKWFIFFRIFSKRYERMISSLSHKYDSQSFIVFCELSFNTHSSYRLQFFSPFARLARLFALFRDVFRKCLIHKGHAWRYMQHHGLSTSRNPFQLLPWHVLATTYDFFPQK